MVMRLGSAGRTPASRAPSCRSRRIIDRCPRRPSPRALSTQSTIARPLALSSGKVRELVIHSGRSASRAIDHVGREVGEQEEQGRAEQPLEHPEPAAEHAVDRPEHRPPRLAADRAGEQLHERWKLGTNSRAKASTAAPALGPDARRPAAPDSGVWNSFSTAIADDPGEQRQHFMDEAAHEADQRAAAEQQDDEDVERGHWRPASGRSSDASPAHYRPRIWSTSAAQVGELGERDAARRLRRPAAPRPVSKPSLAASLSRRPACATGRTSPDSAISPSTTAFGRHRPLGQRRDQRRGDREVGRRDRSGDSRRRR